MTHGNAAALNMKPPPPIQTLPREIIGEIILHALGYYSPRSNPEPVNLDTRKGPWVYSQVCRLWREEACSLQSIWTNIRLDRVADCGVGCPAVLEILLSRSKQPLDIDIGFRDATVDTYPMLASLTAESSRWRNIKLSTANRLTVNLSSMVSLDLSSLESLDIDNEGGGTGALSANVIVKKFLSSAPKLRRVSFTYVMSIAKLGLPWSQLTHLRTHTFRSSFAGRNKIIDLEILNSMPNLVRFEANILVDCNPGGAEIAPHNLHHIGLGDSSSSRLRLPQLLTLHLIRSSGHDNAIHLVRRSGCCIQTLILGLGVESVAAAFVPLCTELTSVITLELRGKYAGALFDFLTTEEPPKLPNLTTIKFCNHSLANFIEPDPPPYIIKFLKARIPRGLKELCFSGNLQGYTERRLFDLEMRYRQKLGELETRLVIQFEETDTWGEPVGRYCSIPRP